MIENYQEEEEMTAVEPQEANFATIGKIYDDGVSLIWDDTGTESEKHYKVNSFAVFRAGDRVRIVKDSKTYVVEYSVGNPKKTFNADSATSALSANKANTATNATTATNADNAAKLNNKTEANLSVNFAKTATTATNFTGRHTGSNIGFFNMSGTYQRTVSQATSDSATRTQLNALINALKAYGLIKS